MGIEVQSAGGGAGACNMKKVGYLRQPTFVSQESGLCSRRSHFDSANACVPVR